jgi:hypothetical protein
MAPYNPGVSQISPIPVPLPDEVHQFLLECVPTVPHLETLLLLWRDPRRAWRTEVIAARLYVTPDTARLLLDELRDAGLLEEDDGPGLYRLRLESSRIRVLSLLEDAHARRLREVTTIIHANARRSRAPAASGGKP